LLTYILNKEIGTFQERMYKQNDSYAISISSSFDLEYDHSLNKLGISEVSLVLSNESKLGYLTAADKAKFVGDSTLTIGGYTIVLPITEEDLNVTSLPYHSVHWSYLWYPDLEKLFVYDDETNTGAIPFNENIPYTWKFPGLTFSGTIKVMDAYQTYVNEHTKYSSTYTPYNFNDYDTDPSIWCQMGNRSYTLREKIEVALSSDGVNPDILPFTESEAVYPSNGGVFVLELTQEAKDKLWTLPSNNYFVDVYYIVRVTWVRGVVGTHAVAAKCELLESPPSINPVVKDIYTETTRLTGDSSKLIRFMSIAEYNINGNAGTGSTIAEQYVMNNGTRYDGATGRINNVETGGFMFYLTNSRGMTVSQRVALDVIPYVKLTCNIDYVYPPDPETNEIYFKVKGNCFKGNFGVANNALVVQYRYRLTTDSNYGSWVNVPDSKITRPDGPANTWYAYGTIPNLDYTKNYQVQIRAIDSLATVESPIVRVTTTPVFDWSKEDFKTNVPTILNGWEYGSNMVLWQGKKQMNGDEYILFDTPIQSVPHGIVLVFSSVDSDAGWSTHFVPKEMVNLNQGGGHTFIMVNNSSVSLFGAKYLFIQDKRIDGYGPNDTGETTHSGTTSITSDNSRFVLRYVIGV
jgi:hypothetical protein